MTSTKRINFIPDKEIDFSKEKDLFSSERYVDALKQCINDATEDSMTIGLFGSWGSGKSSIIETVKGRLNGESIRFVKYDAWKYSGDSFRRMFLRELTKQLELQMPFAFDRFYADVSKDERIEQRYSLTFELVLFLLLIFVLVYYFYFHQEITISEFFSFASIIVAMFALAKKEIKVVSCKPKLFAPEQFEEWFKKILDNVLNKEEDSFSQNKDENGDDKKKKKLIIVVDNIDRCPPSMSYALLTEIKTFLGSYKNVIWVIPVDIDAIKQCVLNSSKDIEIQSAEFLRKIFNVALWVKPYHSEEMFEYVKSLNEKYSLELNPTAISIISNEYATNPRRVIQLLNNFQSELKFYDENFRTEHQSLLCQIQIIKEEFPNYYDAIQKNISVYFSIPDDYKKDERLSLFFYRTRFVQEAYKDRRDVLDKILVNGETFSSISEIREKIISPNFIKDIEDYIKDDEQKKNYVADYLRFAIRKAKDRDLYEADMVNLYPLFLEMNKRGISSSIDEQILSLFGEDTFAWSRLLPFIHSYLKDHLRLIKRFLSTPSQSHKVEWMLTSYVNYISKLATPSTPLGNELRESLFYALEFIDKNKYNGDLCAVFRKAYFEDSHGALSHTYPFPSKVYDSQLFSFVIDGIDGQNLEEKDSFAYQFIDIIRNFPETDREDVKEHVMKYIEKLCKFGPIYLREKKWNVISTIITCLTNILSLYDRQIGSDQLINFLNNLVKGVEVSSSKSFLTYALSEDKNEHLSQFLNLVVEVSAKTGKVIIYNDILQSVLEYNRRRGNESIIKKFFINLKDKGFDISVYSGTILNLNERDADYYLLVESLIFNQNTNWSTEGGVYHFLRFLFLESVETDDVFWNFIKRLYSNQEYKYIVLELIKSLPKTVFIPEKIKKEFGLE